HKGHAARPAAALELEANERQARGLTSDQALGAVFTVWIRGEGEISSSAAKTNNHVSTKRKLRHGLRL
ncbi:MAG: hypothetical protein WA679_11780, partial [Pseudolabrys sp.]